MNKEQLIAGATEGLVQGISCPWSIRVLVDSQTLKCVDAHTHVELFKITSNEIDKGDSKFDIIAYDIDACASGKELTLAVVSSSRVIPKGSVPRPFLYYNCAHCFATDGIQVFKIDFQEQICKLVHSCKFEKGMDMDVVDSIRIHNNRVVVRYGERFLSLDWAKGWVVKSKAVSVSFHIQD